MLHFPMKRLSCWARARVIAWNIISQRVCVHPAAELTVLRAGKHRLPSRRGPRQLPLPSQAAWHASTCGCGCWDTQVPPPLILPPARASQALNTPAKAGEAGGVGITSTESCTERRSGTHSFHLGLELRFFNFYLFFSTYSLSCCFYYLFGISTSYEYTQLHFQLLHWKESKVPKLLVI